MDEQTKPRISFWKSLSALDWIALVVCIAAFGASWTSVAVPGLGLLRLAGIIAAFYLLYRFWTRWRNQVLWSLRNRLIVTYLFIAIVPIILLLIFAGLLGQIIYSQLGAYLLYHDIEDRLQMIGDASVAIAAAERTASSKDIARIERDLSAHVLTANAEQLPGLVVKFGSDFQQFRQLAGPGRTLFTGILQQSTPQGTQLKLVGMTEVELPQGSRLIELDVPVTAELLEVVAPDLGPIGLTLAKPVGKDSNQAVSINGRNYHLVAGSQAAKRVLLPPQSWLDPVIDGFSQLRVTLIDSEEILDRDHPVFASFKARASQLNHRIFASLGELSGVRVSQLKLIGAVFLVIELFALLVGIRLTRAITGTISGLSRATQSVQEGNLSARVPVERRDQLGMLGESFNAMTSSITRLISEQKQLQRLENEISIAREVQDQLFPRNLPHVEGVEIEAICRAARSVSGDYYDFIQLSPTQVAIAIADISGKGISAALLMASLQAALRSQLLTPGAEGMSTAELVSRLNRHLVRNTGDDRFATFFVAIYDLASRKLRYTNAGHLPGFCLSNGKATHLDVGGIVLGIVEEYPYQEGCVDVPHDAVLITYSDGLVEPENAYGEEFGISRLEAAAQGVRQAAPRRIAESLMTAAEEWSGTPEQMDDMTVLVAKLR